MRSASPAPWGTQHSMRLIDHLGVARPHAVVGDHQRRDAGTRHAAGADGAGLAVAPRSVGILASLPILFGQPPCSVLGRHADALGLVQRQQGELGIGVVARAAAHAGIRPRPGIPPLADLRVFQPLHAAGGSAGHLCPDGPGPRPSFAARLRRSCWSCLAPSAKVFDRLSHRVVAGLDAGIQQCQGA